MKDNYNYGMLIINIQMNITIKCHKMATINNLFVL